MSRWPDYLNRLTTATTMPELLDHLYVTQKHDTMLQKYWLLACGTHADYSIMHNSTGEFLTFKGRLHILKNLVPTILYKYHDAQGCLVSSGLSR